MANILVVGASRGIGDAVCRAALTREHNVRGMSRGGRLPSAGLSERCQAYAGDALDPETVRRALDGMDVVVQALGVPLSLDLLTKPVTLFSGATRVLLPQMAAAGVEKLVSITGFGAGDSRDSINLLQRVPFKIALGRAYDDKSIQENLIEDSDLDWLIVRPGVLTSGPLSDKYRVLKTAREWRNGIVSRTDVADFIVKRIEAGELGREKPVVIRCPL